MGFEYPPNWSQRCFPVTWLVPRETAAVSAQVLCTPYNYAPLYGITLFEATYVGPVHVCLAVTCQCTLQNDRGHLCATAVTRGWNGHRNKSQHRKLTLEKTILPPFLPGLEPETFQSRVCRSNHGAIHAPQLRSWPSKLKDAKQHRKAGDMNCNSASSGLSVNFPPTLSEFRRQDTTVTDTGRMQRITCTNPDALVERIDANLKIRTN